MSAIHLGWTPDPEAVARVIEDTSVPVYRMTDLQEAALQAGSNDSRDKPPVILFDALKPLDPNWTRGNQAIGDCVSWGWELGCTLSVATDLHFRKKPYWWPGQMATEPFYGGARVEARGIQRGGYQDGAIGAYAAKFAVKWGALPRIDHSRVTGNPEHDLRKYSGEKSKAWGNFGCGGAFDKGKLDELCKLTPILEAPQVSRYEQAKAVIESGYPVVVCSDQGLSSKRDKYGFVKPSETWYHCMVFAGVRYDIPGLLDVNSWGNSWGLGSWFLNAVTGEVIEYWPEVQKCSAWVDARTCERMLAQGDSYAVCGMDGLKKREIDWSKGWEIT